MNTQISALSCIEDYLDSLIALGSTYYPNGHSALSKDFLRWFYCSNPCGPATLIVAHEGELWIGLIALIPFELEYQGRSQKACFAVNVLTHPDHRTKNLFVKMIGCARQTLSDRNIWLVGHPNSNAIPGWKRQKMSFKRPLDLFVAKFNVNLPLKKISRIDTIHQLKRLPTDFWSSLTKRQDIHVKYTPEFLAWRFLDAPHRKYQINAIELNSRLLGLRVTRRFKGPVDLMVDCIAPSSDLSAVLSSVRWPTLFMHAAADDSIFEVKKGAWNLPVKRSFPFFVTTWNDVLLGEDVSGISLTASDF